MVPFKLTILGKKLDCEQYGFTEDTVYKNKSFYYVFGNIASRVMCDGRTLCTIVTFESNSVYKIVKRFNLKGIRIQHIFKMCNTTWLTSLITMLNYKGVNQVIFIDILRVNRISELKQIDSYCKRHDISLIVREQIPQGETNEHN